MKLIVKDALLSNVSLTQIVVAFVRPSPISKITKSDVESGVLFLAPPFPAQISSLSTRPSGSVIFNLIWMFLEEFPKLVMSNSAELILGVALIMNEVEDELIESVVSVVFA